MSVDMEQVVFPHGATVEWLHQRQICVLRLTKSHRAAFDEWGNQLKQIFETWDRGRLVLLMLDLRGQSLTPYIRKQTLELWKLNPDKPERLVILMGNDMFGLAIKMFMTLVMRIVNNADSQTRIFQDYQQALNWLESFLGAAKSTP